MSVTVGLSTKTMHINLLCPNVSQMTGRVHAHKAARHLERSINEVIIIHYRLECLCYQISKVVSER